MTENSVSDVYIEVRKRGASKVKIEKENFETLQAIEESIKQKTKGAITPVKYFNALMNMLNTNTGYYRSVFDFISALFIVALFASVSSSGSSCICQAEQMLWLYGSIVASE